MSSLDVILLPIALIGLITMVFISTTFFNDWIGIMQNDDLIANSTITQVQEINNLHPLMDYLLLLVIALLYIVLWVSARLIPSIPAFGVIGLLGIIIATIFAGMFSNFLVEFINNSQFAPIIDSFPVSVFLSSNLGIVTLVGGALFMISFYSKEDPTYGAYQQF
jgi:glucan phosphoethanolaminetransferase (alkaline phosphatase superfamily)